MKGLTPKKIAAALGGTFYGKNEIADIEVTDVLTDSRKIVPGCLFVPIRGERTDGHLYIEQALRDGALFVFTERPEDKDRFPCIVVPDTLAALQGTAKLYLSGLSPQVVAVTGSVGKTSTKEMIASVLSRHFRTRKSPGNFNNEIGLPLSVLSIREEDEVAVLEMGINHFGEMDVLADIAPPKIAVFTNIGPCHLEFLGDLDGVLREKGSMLRHLLPGGRVIANGEDPMLRKLRCPDGTEPVYYGRTGEVAVAAEDIVSDGTRGTSCVVTTPAGRFPIEIPYPGEHMILNALAACAVGYEMGLSPEEMQEGIRDFVLPSGRLEEVTGAAGETIINDCYNANPASMKASLTVLAGVPGRKIAVLGDMGELGENAPAYHREVGRFAAGLSLTALIVAGNLAKEIASGAREDNASGTEIYSLDSAEEAIAFLRDYLRAGDTVLIKASRAMEFERITAALRLSE